MTTTAEAAEKMARWLHETYEDLAPAFGYVTREDTRRFDPKSNNGRLMIEVCWRFLETKCTTRAEIAVEEQHGPVTRVTVDGTTVSVYLMDQTGVVTTESGQYGIEVEGPWPRFKAAIAQLVRLGP